MLKDEIPEWLKWAREIMALSQTGLTFVQNEFEKDRYWRLMEIAAEMIASQTNINKASLLENFKIQQGYATPKVDVRGAVIRDGKILLVQERSDQKWSIPGGWADVGDLPSDMVVREVWEESGFKVKPVKVIGVFDANRDGRPLELYHAYKIIFLCDIIGGSAKPGDETSAVEFYDFNKLPPLSLNRTNQRHLSEIIAHIKNPNRPAFFD